MKKTACLSEFPEVSKVTQQLSFQFREREAIRLCLKHFRQHNYQVRKNIQKFSLHKKDGLD